MFSQAAAALAAALGHSPKKAEPSLRGRPISSEDFTYDLDSLQASEAPQELVVSADAIPASFRFWKAKVSGHRTSIR